MVLAYFITFHTYGTWLHGSDRGSVDDAHNRRHEPLVKPNSARQEHARRLLIADPLRLTPERRFIVQTTIEEVCTRRLWRLYAINVRSTHVHVVVHSPQTPERVMTNLKAYCTRRMREVGEIEVGRPAWAHHGSTRYLKNPEAMSRAIAYVVHQQGHDLDQRLPRGWIEDADRL